MHFKIGNVPLPSIPAESKKAPDIGAIKPTSRGSTSIPNPGLNPYQNVTQYGVPQKAGGMTMAPNAISQAPANPSLVGSTQIPVAGTSFGSTDEGADNKVGKTVIAHVLEKGAWTTGDTMFGTNPQTFVPWWMYRAGQHQSDEALKDRSQDRTGRDALTRFKAQQGKTIVGPDGIPRKVEGMSWWDKGIPALWDKYVRGVDPELESLIVKAQENPEVYGRYFLEAERATGGSQHKKEIDRRIAEVKRVYAGIANQQHVDDLKLRAKFGDQTAAAALDMLNSARVARSGFGAGGFPAEQQKQIAQMGSPTGEIMGTGPGGMPAGFFSADAYKAMSSPWFAHQLMGGKKPEVFFPAGKTPPVPVTGAAPSAGSQAATGKQNTPPEPPKIGQAPVPAKGVQPSTSNKPYRGVEATV